MLLCDTCGSEWHMCCITPVVTRVPKGRRECWKCWKSAGGLDVPLDVGSVEEGGAIEAEGEGEGEGEELKGKVEEEVRGSKGSERSKLHSVALYNKPTNPLFVASLRAG